MLLCQRTILPDRPHTHTDSRQQTADSSYTGGSAFEVESTLDKKQRPGYIPASAPPLYEEMKGERRGVMPGVFHVYSLSEDDPATPRHATPTSTRETRPKRVRILEYACQVAEKALRAH